MKLLLMIHSLAAGGAERVLTLIADGLASRGHQVHLLTLTGCEDDFFDPGRGVHRVCLEMATESKSALGAMWANLRRARAIRSHIRAIEPNVVLSFTTAVNVLGLIASSGTSVPVVVSERTNPQAHSLPLRWRILRALTYRRAHTLVVQTIAAADWFRRRLPAAVAIEVIENPTAAGEHAGEPEVSVPSPFILAAGRLAREKGFDVLIEAFALAAGRLPELSLAIAGTGPEEQALKRLGARRGLEGRIHFPGRVRALAALMEHARALVLSSRYEGFPNVLLEALASGLPVVAVDCPSGPREILSDGRYGLLVPPEDPRALAEAIVRIATDGELRERLSATGPLRAACYHPRVIVARWEQTLRGCGAPGANQVPRS